jgi:hypothetical protein
MSDKDLNYYLDLLRMDAKSFVRQADTTWIVSYKKLPMLEGKGIGTSEAEHDLLLKAKEWITKSLENGNEIFVKDKSERYYRITPRPCPFCGCTDIKVDIESEEAWVGCRNCHYEINVGAVYFNRHSSVENQARNLWNKLRPLETDLLNKVAELEARIKELGQR